MTFRNLTDTKNEEQFSPPYESRFCSTRGAVHLEDFPDLAGEYLPELAETPVEQLTEGDTLYKNATGLSIVAKRGQFQVWVDGVLRTRCGHLMEVQQFLEDKVPLQTSLEGIGRIMAAIRSWGK